MNKPTTQRPRGRPKSHEKLKPVTFKVFERQVGVLTNKEMREAIDDYVENRQANPEKHLLHLLSRLYECSRRLYPNTTWTDDYHNQLARLWDGKIPELEKLVEELEELIRNRDNDLLLNHVP